MVYHGLLLAAQIMQLWLLTDSITSTNTLELLGFFAFQFCSFVYTVVQVFQEQYLDRLIIAAWPVSYEGSAGAEVYRTHTNLAWGLMAVNASFVVCWVGLSWKMYKDWGWRKYRRVGADMAVRRRVWWHQVSQTAFLGSKTLSNSRCIIRVTCCCSSSICFSSSGSLASVGVA
jgi:hypothetical protein